MPSQRTILPLTLSSLRLISTLDHVVIAKPPLRSTRFLHYAGQRDLLGEACHGNCCVDAMGHLPLPHPAPLLQARACVNCLPSVGLRMVSAIAPVLHPTPPALDVNAHVGQRHMRMQCTIPGCQARKVHTPASMVFSMHALQIRATSGVESVVLVNPGGSMVDKLQ